MQTAIRRKRKGDGRWMQLVSEGRVGADVEARREEETSLILLIFSISVLGYGFYQRC